MYELLHARTYIVPYCSYPFQSYLFCAALLAECMLLLVLCMHNTRLVPQILYGHWVLALSVLPTSRGGAQPDRCPSGLQESTPSNPCYIYYHSTNTFGELQQTR